MTQSTKLLPPEKLSAGSPYFMVSCQARYLSRSEFNRHRVARSMATEKRRLPLWHFFTTKDTKIFFVPSFWWRCMTALTDTETIRCGASYETCKIVASSRMLSFWSANKRCLCTICLMGRLQPNINSLSSFCHVVFVPVAAGKSHVTFWE